MVEVFKLTKEEIQDLHEQTDCGFFKCDEDDHTIIPQTTVTEDGFYLYPVKRFCEAHPDVDVSKLTVIDFVPKDIEI